MYQFISSLNSIIREEIMPNPFEFISENPIIILVFTSLIGSKIIHKLAFSMCGIFYNKGEAPILGSIIYMFFWGLNTWILIKLSEVFNSVLEICSIYAMSIIAIYVILYKIKKIKYIV